MKRRRQSMADILNFAGILRAKFKMSQWKLAFQNKIMVFIKSAFDDKLADWSREDYQFILYR